MTLAKGTRDGSTAGNRQSTDDHPETSRSVTPLHPSGDSPSAPMPACPTCARCGFDYCDCIHLPHGADPAKESMDGLLYCVFVPRTEKE